MPIHSFNAVFIHLVWSTIEREKIFFDSIRLEIYDYLVTLCAECGFDVYALNVQPEHIHILIQLPVEVSVLEVVKKLKGNSSKWINDNKLLKTKFSWQRGYGAFSVSSSQFTTVKNYIYKQDEHHKRVSFENEYKTWSRRYEVTKSQAVDAKDALKYSYHHTRMRMPEFTSISSHPNEFGCCHENKELDKKPAGLIRLAIPIIIS